MDTDSRRVESEHKLRIALFGPPKVEVNGAPVAQLRSRKGMWLLALLTIRGRREVSREWLMGALWPDAAPQNASASLRQSLADLRRALGPLSARIVSPSPRTLSLDIAPREADVLSFDEAIADGSPGALETAVGAYSGPLLEGCDEDRAIQERNAREQAYLNALEALAERDRLRGSPATAAERLRLVIGVDPYREHAHRALIESLAAAGDFASAIIAYRDLRLLLRRELGTEPHPDTVAAYERARSEARTREALAEPGDADFRGVQLPRPFTTLVGRDRHIREVRDLLDRSRLVTLIGPGGVGKTRLAIGASEEVADGFADGVRFVDLAPLTEPNMLAGWVIGALGAPEAGGKPALRRLSDRLRDRAVLLVLDNCEHLIEACASFCAAVLADCAHCRVLATSRQPLGIMGEALYRVPPLDVPCRTGTRDATHELAAGEAMRYDGVRLFAERARLVASGFSVTDSNAGVVADICRQMDGLPLGIELAASRVRAMSLPEIASRLSAHYGLTMNGIRGVPERHHSIKAAIRWSYDLLDGRRQALLRGLSVFAGGFDLADAEAVCAERRSEPTSGGSPDDIAVLLTELVDQSLVVYEPLGDNDRYSLLETVRAYARDRLVEAGEEGVMRERHARHFLRYAAECAGPQAQGAMDWYGKVARNHDNIRAALDWLCESGLTEEALQLGAAMAFYWTAFGYRDEGRARLRAILNLPRNGEDDPVIADVLLRLGSMEWAQGDAEASRESCSRAHEIYRKLGNGRGIAAALLNLGSAALSLDRTEEARRLFEDAITASRLVGRPSTLAHALLGLGELQRHVGEFQKAEETYGLAREAAVEAGDSVIEALCTADLGTLALQRGDCDAARDLLCSALDVEPLGATDWLVCLLLPTVAGIELAQGRPERSAVLLGAAEAARLRTNTAVQRADLNVLIRCTDRAREACGDRTFAESFERGRALSVGEALGFAREGALALS